MSKSHGATHVRRVAQPASSASNNGTSDLLAGTAAQILRILASEAANVLEQRMQIGRLTELVRVHAQYGEAGVAKLAPKVRLRAKMLFRLAGVARTFSPEDFAGARRASDEVGYTLSISLLLEVSEGAKTDADRVACRQLLYRAIDEKWTVARVRAQKRAGRSSPSASTAAGSVTLLAKLAAQAQALRRELHSLSEQLDALDRSYPSFKEERDEVVDRLCDLRDAIGDVGPRLSVLSPSASGDLLVRDVTPDARSTAEGGIRTMAVTMVDEQAG
ncbi:MAG TPA: hypothetical protein VG734_01850 [Lacunisphaera sp.]|nr:hypothetical protein [Lacunisphaera sp.]